MASMPADGGKDVRKALRKLARACFAADVAGDLPPQIDGGLIEDAWKALGMLSPERSKSPVKEG